MFKPLILALCATAAMTALAEGTTPATPTDSKNAIKIDEVSGQKNKVEGDIDQEITNARLRADSGSKSKWSLSLSTAYTGGSIEQPFGEKRPKLSADPGVQAFTSLDMGLSGRWRWNKNDSLTLGTTFGFVTPFQGRVNKSQDAVNVNDPLISYNHSVKLETLGLQTVGKLTYGYGTSIPSRQIDLTNELAVSYNMMHQFASKLTAGASVSAYWNDYDSGPAKNRNTLSRNYGGDTRTEYGLGIFPQAEWGISDKLSARTVFGYFNWRHLYGDTKTSRLLQTYVYQSLGVGWSVSRDVYLYPNVQFVPDNIRADFTNVALSATINIF